MLYRKFAAVLAAASLVACAEPPAEEAPVEEAAVSPDQEAIAALADYWETHYNTQQPDMVAAKYIEDAWVAPAEGGVLEGREAVLGWLTETTAQSPTVEISPMETMVMGDQAVGIGRWSVTVTPEGGETMTYGGAYMNHLVRVDGEWLIAGSANNYDSPRPDGWPWTAMEGEMPEESDLFPGVLADYEAAWNAGDGAGVAALYTDDASAAWTDAPFLEGKAAIEEAAMGRNTSGSTLDLREVGGMDLGDGWHGVGGWYTVSDADGAVVRQGIWMNLVNAPEGGTPKIHWTVSNGVPAGA